MSKKKRRIKLGKRFVETLEIPQEACMGITKVTLWGKETLLLEKHKGIFECGEKRIRLLTKEGILCIEGDSLVLLELSDERLYISGELLRIAYEM